MANKVKVYNCRACGGQHTSLPELQKCHQARKQASAVNAMQPPEKTEEPEKGEKKPIDEPVIVKKFRKKPVIVEAYQTDKETQIETLEGTMTASPGDWIITGVNGEQYPCKSDVFEKTYEPVDEQQEAKELPTVQAEKGKGIFIIPTEFCPFEIEYMSKGQYMALKILGILGEKGVEVEEVELYR